MPDSIQILLAAAIVVGFLLTVDYLSWKSRDRHRRSMRLVHRNLERARGR